MNAYTINLRNLREDHDLTQQQVAEYLGTSQTMVPGMSGRPASCPCGILSAFASSIRCLLMRCWGCGAENKKHEGQAMRLSLCVL